MELNETQVSPEYPDVYWAAGDEVFQLMQPPDRTRTLRLRANMNHNLLVNRRLFLADTSMLVSPSMFALLRDEQLGPGYQQLFRDGLVVPSMRDSANNFSEVAKQIIEKRNFVAEMEQERIWESARLLDSLHPEIIHTDSRKQMKEVGEVYLLDPEYWIALGLPELEAVEMTKSVTRKIETRGLDTVRQSEFWEYARDTLDHQGQHERAQQVRAYMSIASLGVIAKWIGVPPIFPAAYGTHVDRMYGTHTPWRLDEDYGISLLPPFEMKDPQQLRQERSIYEIAAILTAEQVSATRSTKEHSTLLRKMKEFGLQHESNSPGELEQALAEFRTQLEVDAGELISDWPHHGRSFLWETVQGQLIRQPAPGAIGYLVARVNEYFGLTSDPLHLVGPGTGVTLGVSVLLYSWHKARTRENRRDLFRRATMETVRDRTIIPELRHRGIIECGLFGTIPYSFNVPRGQ